MTTVLHAPGTPNSQAKRALLEHALHDGLVSLWCEIQHEGVSLPLRTVQAHLAQAPAIRLDLNYNFAQDIALVIDEWGWRATLSFGGVPFRCQIPWTAVRAMRGKLLGEVQWPAEAPAPVPEAAPTPFKGLRLVRDGDLS